MKKIKEDEDTFYDIIGYIFMLILFFILLAGTIGGILYLIL
jgi:hypothetical protein